MDKKRQKLISKYLSYVLRHKPESIEIKLDSNGWTDVSTLLRQSQAMGLLFTLDELKLVVKENDKQRFSFSEDSQRIRANQGHSISVDLGYREVMPPEILYHGTAKKNIESIRVKGLTKGNRNHVHLSPDLDTAIKVGQRHGKPVVFNVRAGQMCKDGHKFYFSANGIWLTEHVAPEYLILNNKD